MFNHFHGHSHNPDAPGSMQGWAKTYDAMVGLLTFGQDKKMRRATLELAGIQPGECILEVGCGTGTLALAAKAQAGLKGRVDGIDVAPDMIETARRKAARQGLDVSFQMGRIEAIPAPDSHYDLVLSSLMLHHVIGDEAKQQGLREIYRVLKPGGRLLIVDAAPSKNPHLRGLAALFVGHGMMAHGVGEYQSLLDQAGFRDVKTGPTAFSFLGYLSGRKPV